MAGKYFSEENNPGNIITGYEYRSQQPAMADFVYSCFQQRKHGIVEAPTGVGKSLAYLTAAFEYITLRGDSDEKYRLLISTNTLNLQRQLLDKDIPAAVGLTKKGPVIKAFKGRSNYLCLRKMELAEINGLQLPGIKAARLLAQFGTIKSRMVTDREDADFEIDSQLWLQITSDHYSCYGNKCKYIQDCPFYAAKKEAMEADILIINHSLFFADLKIRIQSGERDNILALPPYNAVIFDEAHNVEASATRFLTQSLSVHVFRKLQQDIERDIIKPQHLESSTGKKMLDTLFEQVLEKADELFSELRNRVEKIKRTLPAREDLSRLAFPQNPADDLYQLTEDIGEITAKFFTDADTDELDIAEDLFRMRIDSICERILLFRDMSEKDYVYWCEATENTAFVNAAPVHIGPIIEREVFPYTDSVIMTSATLTVNGNLDYFKSRTGISGCRELVLDSPYPPENTLLYIGGNLPDPNNIDFVEKCSCEVQELLEISQGNAFVLFTSYRTLEDMYAELEIPLVSRNMKVLKQAGQQRHILLNEFKESESPVLFATSSFWEGVDVRGDKLKCLVITRLPFDVPDDPVINSRKQQMKNSFMDYILPEAVLRLKQGMGRLIRSSTDRGVIALMDSRLTQKQYGKVILDNFKKFRKTGSLSEVRKFFS